MISDLLGTLKSWKSKRSVSWIQGRVSLLPKKGKPRSWILGQMNFVLEGHTIPPQHLTRSGSSSSLRLLARCTCGFKDQIINKIRVFGSDERSMMEGPTLGQHISVHHMRLSPTIPNQCCCVVHATFMSPKTAICVH